MPELVNGIPSDIDLSLIKFYRENPIIATQDLLNVDLADVQQVVMNSYWFKTFVMTVASRGFGKTFMFAVYACLRALLYPGTRIGFLAPTFRQSKFIFAEVDKIYGLSPILQSACAKPPVKASDRCYLQFNGTTGRTGRHLHI